jgi:hypothetical protein
MTTNSDFDRQAAAWLAEGPTELHDRVLDAALLEVHRTRQRRGLIAPWRLPRMHGMFRFATAAMAVVIAVLGTAYIAGYRPSLGPAGVPTPAPASATVTAACGHELAQGLYLTPGCVYLTSNLPPSFSIVSDGSWLDTFQTPTVLDFIGMSGPARGTSIRLRPLQAVLEDPCQWGSSPRRSAAPRSAREYLDWLGPSLAETELAVEIDRMGLHGWRLDTGAGMPVPTRTDTCNLVSLAEPPAGTLGEAEALVIDPQVPVRVYVLDTHVGVLLVSIEFPDAAALAASEAFLAAMHAQP